MTNAAEPVEFIYRMPTEFGPSLGPRQGPGGQRFTGQVSRAAIFTAQYTTDADRLAALLPSALSPGEEPLVTVRVHHNTSMAWLGGRAYHYVEVMLRCRHEGTGTEGDFISVMWENSADAIVVGRDELGHPKVWADIPEPIVAEGNTAFTASWGGFDFFHATFYGIEFGPWPHEREDDARAAPAATGLAGLPRFNHKYIPNSENMSEADVDYVVMMPAGLYEYHLLDRWQGRAEVAFTAGGWEELPTQSNIVTPLAALPVLAMREATMIRGLRAFNDLRGVAKVLH